MKVAFAFDHLLERDSELFLLESLLGYYPDAEVYCVAHNPDQIVGPVALRNIKSTFLGHMVKKLSELNSKFHLIPGAVDKYEIDPSVDLLICFSRGLSHRFKTKSQQRKIVYWMDPYPYSETQNAGWFKRKFFGGHFNHWVRSTTEEKRFDIFSSQFLRESIASENSSGTVLMPPVKNEDFAVVENPKRDVFLVYLPAAIKSDLKFLAPSQKHKFLVFSSEVLGLEETDQVKEIEVGCDGIFASELNRAKAFINLQTENFPARSVQALLSGVPVFQRDYPLAREVLYNNDEFETPFYSTLEELTPLLESAGGAFPQREARRWALAFNERKFKHQFKNLIDKAMTL